MVEHAIQTIVGAGKACGTLGNRRDVCAYIQLGVHLLYDHADHMLASGSEEFFARIKGR